MQGLISSYWVNSLRKPDPELYRNNSRKNYTVSGKRKTRTIPSERKQRKIQEVYFHNDKTCHFCGLNISLQKDNKIRNNRHHNNTTKKRVSNLIFSSTSKYLHYKY